ncbi:MAG: AI-2E family transporter [Bacteroidetes bacterium]|nr:AI-2E family transporter [Bacteroidota bacterium]
MIKKEPFLPVYAKATIFLVGLFALMAILYIAQGIIIPIVFAIIIAILLQPVVDFFVRFHVNRVIAIIITLLLSIIIIASVGVLIFSQASRFSESWPLLVEKFTLMLDQVVVWISSYFDINPKKLDEWILKTKTELISNSSAVIGQTIVTVGSGVVVTLLVPVYVFMILFYQPLLLDFIRKLFAKNHQSQVAEIVTQTKTVIQRYLIGLVIEFIIVATMDSAALFALGIQYAILLGIIGGLLNLIPYIGGLVAVALPMMVALATKSTAWYAAYVLVAYYIIQLIDNNYIVPKIVASKVKINALFSIIVVLAGNALWGIPGMFLSIPILAIIKLIFDHIESLKPWGFLLDDTMPAILNIKPILTIIKKKAK